MRRSSTAAVFTTIRIPAVRSKRFDSWVLSPGNKGEGIPPIFLRPIWVEKKNDR